jgi:hypothetical protein
LSETTIHRTPVVRSPFNLQLRQGRLKSGHALIGEAGTEPAAILARLLVTEDDPRLAGAARFS